jgi:hypothetical protein
VLPEVLAELAATRADEMDTDTVNRELSIARKAIGWCQRQGSIEGDPTIGIERRPVPPDRTKALTHDAEDGTSTRCCWPAPATPPSAPWSGTHTQASTLSPDTSRSATPPPAAGRDNPHLRLVTAFLPVRQPWVQRD